MIVESFKLNLHEPHKSQWLIKQPFDLQRNFLVFTGTMIRFAAQRHRERIEGFKHG